MHARWNMHVRILSEQPFMEIDYVGQPPSPRAAVTLTHGNRGDSFPRCARSGSIFGHGSFAERTRSCSANGILVEPACVRALIKDPQRQ